MQAIEKNTVVYIRYTMYSQDGTIIENRMNGPAVSFLQGSDAILPLLQEQLAGLAAGAHALVRLPKNATASGEAFSFDVIVDAVRAASPAEILLGYAVDAITADCDADCACYAGVFKT